MKLFEYAVIFTEWLSKEQINQGQKPKSVLAVDVTRILASSEQEAAMRAARDIPDQYKDQLAQCQVIIRPF